MAKEFVCTECGYVGKAKKTMKGNFLIEVVLWLTFIIPGVIYSIWRLANTPLVCPKCGKESLIPTDTPKGMELKNKFTPEIKT